MFCHQAEVKNAIDECMNHKMEKLIIGFKFIESILQLAHKVYDIYKCSTLC